MSFRLFTGSRFDRNRGFGGRFPSIATCPCCGQTLAITVSGEPRRFLAECRHRECLLARMLVGGRVGDSQSTAVGALREAWFDRQQEGQ